MTLRAMTIDDVATELGKSGDWTRRHWPRLVREGRLPPPLVDGPSPTWDPAQVYAVRDKHLPAAVRANAAAIRAAFDAALSSRANPLAADDVVDGLEKLRRFAAGAGP